MHKDYTVEARYLTQVWELDASFTAERFAGPADVDALVESFHRAHERVFAVRDDAGQVECLNWRGRLTVKLGSSGAIERSDAAGSGAAAGTRTSCFDGNAVDVPVFRGRDLVAGQQVTGPALIEEPTTTVVIYPGAIARVSANDNYIITV